MGEIESSSATARTRRRGRGGASARRDARSSLVLPTFGIVKRSAPPMNVLDEEAMALIEANADKVMEEIGVEFREDGEALEMWKEAGADVRGERVHLPKGLCRELMKSAPATFTQHARNASRSVEIGGRNTVFAPVYGPPFIRALDGERRYARLEDFQNLVRLAYMAPAMHHSGGTVCEPVDVAVNKRHLDMVYAHIKYSDKAFMGSVTAPERAVDTVEMAKILFGAEFVDNNCVLTSLININSPLVMDATMLGALKIYARAGQACIISPFIVGGAMSPAASSVPKLQCARKRQSISLSRKWRTTALACFRSRTMPSSMTPSRSTKSTSHSASFSRSRRLTRSASSWLNTNLPMGQSPSRGLPVFTVTSPPGRAGRPARCAWPPAALPR